MTESIVRCQNCRCPLDIDMSLVDLSVAQRDLLVYSERDQNEPNPSVIPQERLKILRQAKHPSQIRASKSANVAESYIFLADTEDSLQKSKTGGEESAEEEEDDDRSKTLSSRINALNNIFNILSSKNNIDYPVCQGCCDTILEKLKEEYNHELKQRDTYYQFMKRLQEQRQLSGDNLADDQNSKKSLELLKQEKESLLASLIAFEDEDVQLNKEMEQLQKELLEKRESDLVALEERNIHELEQLSLAKDVQSLKNQHVVTLNHIDKLRKINIYNETFRISHNGPFGTINNLRLGSLPETKVPWSEINASLGQVILLLSLIADNLSINLKDYKLMPLGSHSTVEKLDKISGQWLSFCAFNEKDFLFGSFFHKETGLDRALVSILDIIKQLTNHISAASQDPDSIELPYEISNDKINRLSIVLNGSSPSLEWTTACKFLLTDVKWLLAFSTTYNEKYDRRN